MTAIEIISSIESMNLGISAEQKLEIVKQVLTHPERGEEIVKTLEVLQNENRIDSEYLSDMESVVEKEKARKEAKIAAEKQAKERDNKLRNAALANIMAMENHPVYGTKAFETEFERQYKALKNGKNICFDPAGTAFVYDCELSQLSEDQRKAVERQQTKLRITNKVIGKIAKQLPDGAHFFHITDVKEKEVNGVLRQYLTLEEEATGYKAWFNWIVDEHVDSRDYRFTREYQIRAYSDANGDVFATSDEETALKALMQSGLKAWSYTAPDAEEMDDGRKFARIFLTEDQYNYAINRDQRRAAARFDAEQRRNETKAGTWKF